MTRTIQKTTDREAAPPASVAVGAPRWIGASLFGITAPAHLFLDFQTSIAVAAVLLALIGGTYIGFGAADGRRNVFWSELGVAGLFGVTAVMGLLWHWFALPVGLALHALWDLVHHNSRALAWVPGWYIPLCVVYDLLAAAFLILLYGVWM